MQVLFLDPIPPDVKELLQKWQSWGDGRHWEVWDGVLHINAWPEPAKDLELAPGGLARAQLMQQVAELLGPPARAAGLSPVIGGFRLGELGDHRTPEGGLLRELAPSEFVGTAALVLEVVSPGAEPWERLSFYGAHNVDEVLVVDPQQGKVDWLGLGEGGDYRLIERSALIELRPAELRRQLGWS